VLAGGGEWTQARAGWYDLDERWGWGVGTGREIK
jgi:hypothetical protein